MDEPVGMWDLDYNICGINADGKHGPLVQDFDYEISEGYLSVMCKACGLCTGVPMPDLEDLEWN